MSNKELQQREGQISAALIIDGDLSRLHPSDKVLYYRGYCERLGLDPFTKPFDLLRLQGREVLYLTRSGAQQLNKMHGVSHQIISRELMQEPGIFQVIARATLPDGRFTESMSAVSIANLKGEAYCNALMKAETKAKRRSTLDLLGLGILSEEEAVSLPGERVEIKPEVETVAAEVIAEDEPELDIEKAVNMEYGYPEEIVEVLGYVQTMQQLNALYLANKKTVEFAGLKPMFSDRKKYIQSQNK